MNSGDPCIIRGCKGKLKTYKTKVFESAQCRRRSLRCNTCHHTPKNNTIMVPLVYAPRRPRPPRRLKKQRRLFR